MDGLASQRASTADPRVCYVFGMRTIRFGLFLSEEEAEMLEKIGGWDGLSGSDVVRQLLRREHGRRVAVHSAPANSSVTRADVTKGTR